MEIGKKYKVIDTSGTQNYCPQYIGQWVTVVSNRGYGYYEVETLCGKQFMCPMEYLEQSWEDKTPFGKSCECGAQKTYGKETTGLHHSFWCPKRKD